MPASGGEAIQVTKDGGYAPRVAPDGKFLYYTKALNSTSLWKVPIAGGEPSKVLDNLTHYENVAIVKSGVFFAPADDATGTSSSIKFLRFDTNTISDVTSFEKSFVYGVSVSPDGGWMLYSPEQQFRSELMLVENFR